MRLIKPNNWTKGDSYQKRILLDNFERKINLIEDVIVEPNGVIPVHSHDFTDEIFYIIRNSARVVVQNEIFNVTEGDMIYIEKNEKHGFENKSNGELKMIVMKINYRKGDSYLK